MPLKELSPLLQVHRKISWMRFQLKGNCAQFRGSVSKLLELNSNIHKDLPAATYYLGKHHRTCQEALQAIEVAEKELLKSIEEMYECFREQNPPIRDRRRHK